MNNVGKMKKIYVASSWRNNIQPQIVKFLRAAGYEVYDFKNPRPGDNGFHWSEIDSNWKDWTPQEFIEGLDHPIAERGFVSDMTALRECDICVLVLPCGRSAHLEAGWAVGAGKQVLVYIPEQCEPELMYKMTDEQCTDINELVYHIEQYRYLAQAKQIKSLNSLPVEDFSCCQGECEYVLADVTAENIKILLDAGFTAGQIDESMGDDKDFIDLSILAFQHLNAMWWSGETGFTQESYGSQPLESSEDLQRCRVCGCTQYSACPGGCYWVEDDLCSRCAEDEALAATEP